MSALYESCIFLTERVLTTEARKRLKDEDFGIPEERKFPLHDATHVRSAASYFHKAPEGKRKALAARIVAAAKSHKVEIDEDSLVHKYV